MPECRIQTRPQISSHCQICNANFGVLSSLIGRANAAGPKVAAMETPIFEMFLVDIFAEAILLSLLRDYPLTCRKVLAIAFNRSDARTP
jgi:hypothetical protein